MNFPDDPLTQLAREIVDGGMRDRLELQQRWKNPSQWLNPAQASSWEDDPMTDPAIDPLAGLDETNPIGRTDNGD